MAISRATQTLIETTEQHHARRLRQIGLRDALLAITMVAVVLALYAPNAIAQAVVVSTALLILFWQTKGVRALADVPEAYALCGLIMFTLLAELIVAWLTGTRRVGMLPFTVFFCVFRGLLMLICIVYVLFEVVRIALREPRHLAENASRIGLTGRLATLALSLPMFFSSPIANASLRASAAAIDPIALRDECDAFLASEKPPILKLDDEPFPLLRKLEVQDVKLFGGQYGLEAASNVHYGLYRTDGKWQLSVSSHY